MHVANAADGKVIVFDVSLGDRVIRTLSFDSADNLRHFGGVVYVGTPSAIEFVKDGCGQCETPFRAVLKGDPESFQIQDDGRRIFVNVADESCVQVLSGSGETLDMWQLPDGLGGNFPMCLDQMGRTLFVAARKPVSRACLLALDMDDGRAITGASRDQSAFDD